MRIQTQMQFSLYSFTYLTSRTLFLFLRGVVRSLCDVPVVLAPPVEEDSNGVDKEEEDETKDEDLLNVNVEV